MSNKEPERDAEGNEIAYVQPNVELELSKEKRQACRDIVTEIKNFGVNQRQILFLIQLLAMELENGDAMRAVVKAVGSVRKEIPAGNKLIVTEQKPTVKKKPGLVKP